MVQHTVNREQLFTYHFKDQVASYLIRATIDKWICLAKEDTKCKAEVATDMPVYSKVNYILYDGIHLVVTIKVVVNNTYSIDIK